MPFYATGDAFSRRIISLYLYGQQRSPDERQVRDERFIGRPTPPLPKATFNQNSILAPIDARDFMAGPDRFANPVFFEMVHGGVKLKRNTPR